MPDLVVKGMHKVPHTKEMTARRRAKSIRNRARKPGSPFESVAKSHSFVHHLPCRSYGCKHRKHGAQK